MNEKLLQFIWQFQYYNREDLQTTEAECLHIEHPGQWNGHQGPDFLAASIRIGNTRWAGNIELHIRSSDWHRHQHTGDTRYSNIILHVVWEDDRPLCDERGNPVATVVLEPRVPKLLLERYRQMMQTLARVPCHSFLPVLSALAWRAWKERLVAERLSRKAAQMHTVLRQTQYHWEEVCWRMLAANFGLKINSTLFELVAQSIPVTVCAKHRTQLLQLEALLLGQANLLSGKYTDAYACMLQKEYRFLQKKYSLHPVSKQPAFLRMRPAAFPTIRLAQLAMLLTKTKGLFQEIKNTGDIDALRNLFMVTANDYWHYHYRFDEETAFHPKQLGRQMAENIIINTVAPLLFAYGSYQQDHGFTERAVHFLYRLSPEKNPLTKGWQQAGIDHSSALDSQAFIELTNHYCSNRRCLDCAVGNRILKNDVW
ncbi:DUF2851 family protein [Sediminibacterium soli]|uniref:DUF2851 family protein n=1 Tax=Sediminibacterium soli TaxID=2698829 RepID=UPI00137B2A71|nr:DUF2851 family protein [Sediminibacterium soli]NCI47074.1 DUF2851 family protein [Sediminibacterium soli]